MKALFKKCSNYILMLLFPILIFYLFESYTHNAFTTMKVPIQLLNIVFFELVMALLFFFLGHLKWALMLETMLFAFIGLANYFVLQFRSAPIMPWDLLSVKVAASVAGNYNYTLKAPTVFVLIVFVILLALEWKFCTLRLELKLRNRLIGLIITILLLCGFVFTLHQDATIKKFQIYDKLFTPAVMSKRDGTMTAFLIELKYMSVSKPSGYDASEAEKLLASYETSETVSKTPNIIVIMDEAFSDLSVLGDFDTNIDYMPFVHSLMSGAENTQSGYLNVSVLGGNTPNTEFEYLTGNTLAFLPNGSIPYQQYISSAIPSMTSYLKDLGYTTIGMHPYHASGWNREAVYPMLGFDEAYFEPYFIGSPKVRDYISDAGDFQKIIDSYEDKEAKTPLFLFNVTMQNHSSYDGAEKYDNFTPDVTLTNNNTQTLSNYLSLIKLTDSAFENLVTYFAGQDEPTLIVLFGDHQPTDSIAEPVWQENGKSGSSLTDKEEYERYEVPFVIWANYDIDEITGLETSANYLGSRTLDVAGLPLSPYFSFLEEQEQSFPVVSATHVMDNTGTTYSYKEQKNALNTYAKLQYYQLFGTQN